jgi:hypothetical protein
MMRLPIEFSVGVTLVLINVFILSLMISATDSMASLCTVLKISLGVEVLLFKVDGIQFSVKLSN